jgi:cell division protein FtsA
VGGRDQREVSRAVLASIIEPRMREIFTLIMRELQKNHYLDMLGAGVVLTGGGALMHGAVELAEQVFGMPVKLGVPKGFGGLVDSVATPIHATGVGLVQYGVMRSAQSKEDPAFVQSGDKFKEILRKMTDWVKQYV